MQADALWSELEARFHLSQRLAAAEEAEANGGTGEAVRPLSRQERIDFVKERWLARNGADEEEDGESEDEGEDDHRRKGAAADVAKAGKGADLSYRELLKPQQEIVISTGETIRVLETVHQAKSHGTRKDAVELKKKVQRGLHMIMGDVMDSSLRLSYADILYEAAFQKLQEMIQQDAPETISIIRELWEGLGTFVQKSESEKAELRGKINSAVYQKIGLEEEFSRLSVMVDNFQHERKNFAKYVANQSILRVELEELQKIYSKLVSDYQEFDQNAIWSTLPAYGSAPIQIQKPESLHHLSTDMKEAVDVLTEHVAKVAMLKSMSAEQATQTIEITLKDSDGQTDIVGDDFLEESLRVKIHQLIHMWSDSTQPTQIDFNDSIKDVFNGWTLPESFDFAVNWLQVLPRDRIPEFFLKQYMEILIADIYSEYYTRYVATSIDPKMRPSLPEFVLRFHYHKHGKRAPEKLHDFLFTLIREVNSSVRCRWFSRFCSLPNYVYTPLKDSVFQVFMSILGVALQNVLTTKPIRPLNCSSTGVIIITPKAAWTTTLTFFPSITDDLYARQSRRQRNSFVAHHDILEDNPLDFDNFMEQMMDCWLEDRARGQELMQNMYTAADVDRNGAIDVNELWIVVKAFGLGVENEKIHEVYQYSITRVDGVSFEIFSSFLEEKVYANMTTIINYPYEDPEQSFDILRTRFKEFQPQLEQTIAHMEQTIGNDADYYIMLSKTAISFQMLLVTGENPEVAWLCFAILQMLTRGPPPNWDRYGSGGTAQQVGPEIVRAVTRSSMSWGSSHMLMRRDSLHSGSRSPSVSSPMANTPTGRRMSRGSLPRGEATPAEQNAKTPHTSSPSRRKSIVSE